MSASVSPMSSGTIDRTLARRALALRREGLKGKAIGERLGLTTDQANHMAAVGARFEAIEERRLTDNELLLIKTIGRLAIDSANCGVTRSVESRDVEHRARKYQGWCAATCQRRVFVARWSEKEGRQITGMGLVDLAGNGYVWLTPAGWALAHVLLSASAQTAGGAS